MHFWGLIPPTGCPGKWFRASWPYFELLRPFRLEIRSIFRFFLIFGLFFDPPKNPYSLEKSKNDPFSSFWGLFLSDPVSTPQVPPGHTIFMKKYSYLPEKAHFLQKKKKKGHKPEKNGDFDLKKGQKGPKMTFDKKYFFFLLVTGGLSGGQNI